jgi:hypothetical protein
MFIPYHYAFLGIGLHSILTENREVAAGTLRAKALSKIMQNPELLQRRPLRNIFFLSNKLPKM